MHIASLCGVALALLLAACGDSKSPESPHGVDAVVAEPAAQTPAGSDPDPPSQTQAPAPPAVEPVASAAVAPGETDTVLWVTRDRGSEVLLTAPVEPGVTVIQALGSVADVETRYGGRYVQSIEGIEGDIDGQSDWFFLVNGIEPDVGAAEIKVRAGDTIWWDHRSWVDPAAHPAAVIGAFPEPFANGWKGSDRPVEVTAPTELAAAAAVLEELIGRGGKGDPHRFELVVDAGAEGAELTAAIGGRNSSPVTFTLSGSQKAVARAAEAIAADPSMIRFRYTARFDEQGAIVP